MFSVTSTTTTTTSVAVDIAVAVRAPAAVTSANAQEIDRREHIFGVISRKQLKKNDS